MRVATRNSKKRLKHFIMAKSKSFFGLRTGSTKSLTFQVNQGKQITKDRVSIVKNPRSLAQMQQRLFMATVSAAYAAMKQIVDHSFEGISYGQATMSEFIKENLKLVRKDFLAEAGKFGYNLYQNRDLHAGNYIMAKGSASDLNDAIISATPGSSAQVLNIAAVGTGAAAPTANQFASQLGIAIGEMATICLLVGDVNGDGDYADRFTFVRIKMEKGGDVALTTANLSEYFTVESPDALSFAIAQTGVTINVAINGDGMNVATCAIHSVQADGTWKRNNASFVLPLTWDIQPTSEEAIASYPVGESYVLNGGNF